MSVAPETLAKKGRLVRFVYPMGNPDGTIDEDHPGVVVDIWDDNASTISETKSETETKTETETETETDTVADGVVSYTAYPSHNFDEIYANPVPVSLFCHRKIPIELYNCKIWDHARERLVTKWRQIFSKNFKDRWLWIDVVYDSRRNGWYKVFVHMWCETHRSLFMRSKVLAGETFEPKNWDIPEGSSPNSVVPFYNTGATFTFSKSERPNMVYMHTQYRCGLCMGIPTTCMCCEVDYPLCPNQGVVPGSY